jgi:hypothetical protein
VTSDSPNDNSGRSVQPGDAGGATPEADRIADEAPKHTYLWVLLSGWLLGWEAWLRSHGGRGLRGGIWGFWTVIALLGVVLLVGPVINKPITLDDITSSASTATDRWIAREFAVDYRFALAPDGTLVAEVEERISANFPEGTQERGISRVLATQYEGHALDPAGFTATLDGVPVAATESATSTQQSTNQTTVTIDGADQLSGDHEFVLSYSVENLAYVAVDSANGQPVDLLEWDVFGPSWPQSFAGLDISVTLSDELDDALIRQPRGSLAWTLLSSGAWLDPEPGGASGEVTYNFTNDQRIPPYAQAWFTLSFEPGTIAMPAPTTLFWIQTFGPLAPLGFLAITLLLALAARAVAWGDARGRPWFVAQYEPPRGISARMAAHILRSSAAMELAEVLAAGSKAKSNTAAVKQTPSKKSAAKKSSATTGSAAIHVPSLVFAARIATRTGRIGNWPHAILRYLTALERRTQLTEGYRRVPNGFVRDLFIAAPIALTIVQWGIVRQLSHQTVLAVVWWPVAFVLVSSVIAAVVLTIALTRRPLTEKGALVKQHLRGIGVFAERTQLLERADPSDRLLAYAVLLTPARRAGVQIVALIEGKIGREKISKRQSTANWRTPSFVSWSRITVHALAVVVLAGAITAVSVVPAPSAFRSYATYYGNLPGTIDTIVKSADLSAHLSRTEGGQGVLDVTESLDVEFSDEGSRVPQFAQQWPTTAGGGQDVGLRVESVRIDGSAVSFTTGLDYDTVLLQTTLTEVLTGTHAVQIDYVLESAAVAAEQFSHAASGTSSSTTVDRVRWAALLSGWEFSSAWGDNTLAEGGTSLDTVSFEFSVDDELAELATAGGWLSLDTESADDPSEWEQSVVPFSGALTQPQVLVLERDELTDGWQSDYTWDDTGASMDFPVGTFVGPDGGALRLPGPFANLPMVIFGVVAILALASGAVGVVGGSRRRSRIFERGALRDVVWRFSPAATLATLIVFFWAISKVPADDSSLGPLALATLVAIVASVGGMVQTRMGRRLR